MLSMWVARRGTVQLGPMDLREWSIRCGFTAVTGHPFAEVHVVADDAQACIYVWSARWGVHVCVAHGIARVVSRVPGVAVTGSA